MIDYAFQWPFSIAQPRRLAIGLCFRRHSHRRSPIFDDAGFLVADRFDETLIGCDDVSQGVWGRSYSRFPWT